MFTSTYKCIYIWKCMQHTQHTVTHTCTHTHTQNKTSKCLDISTACTPHTFLTNTCWFIGVPSYIAPNVHDILHGQNTPYQKHRWDHVFLFYELWREEQYIKRIGLKKLRTRRRYVTTLYWRQRIMYSVFPWYTSCPNLYMFLLYIMKIWWHAGYCLHDITRTLTWSHIK